MGDSCCCMGMVGGARVAARDPMDIVMLYSAHVGLECRAPRRLVVSSNREAFWSMEGSLAWSP